MTKLDNKTHLCKKIPHFILYCSKNALPLHPQLGTSPHMVRWMSGLVNGLQNRVHPFESGTHLQEKSDETICSAALLFLWRWRGQEIKNDRVQYPTIGTKWRWRGQRNKNGQVQYPTIETKWRWRGLNPRPNKEAIRFLHAYSCLRFS